MSNVRGRAKRDIERAATNAKHISERISPMMELYADFPEFTKLVGLICEASFMQERMLYDLKRLVP